MVRTFLAKVIKIEKLRETRDLKVRMNQNPSSWDIP